MAAPTPYSIKCNSCLSTIRVRMGCVTGMLLLFSFVLILSSAAALILFNDLLKAGIVILAVLVVFWMGFEIAFGLLVCNVPSLLLPLKLGDEINPKFLFKGK